MTNPAAFPRRNATVRALVLLSAVYLGLPAAAQSVGSLEAGDAVDLKFGSFFRQPVGPRGLELSDALLAADGRTVRLVGYMVAQEDAEPGRFLLTPRPVRMSEHADGDADDLPPNTVTVLLDAGQRARVVTHRAGLVSLVGRLAVGRAEDPQTGRVSWLRLQLAPQALAAEPEPASANANPNTTSMATPPTTVSLAQRPL